MEYKPLQVPASAGFTGSHVEGGVCVAAGFKAGAVHAGFQPDPDRLDLAMVVADEPAAVAGVFTTNVFCAAPVTATFGRPTCIVSMLRCWPMMPVEATSTCSAGQPRIEATMSAVL